MFENVTEKGKSQEKACFDYGGMKVITVNEAHQLKKGGEANVFRNQRFKEKFWKRF